MTTSWQRSPRRGSSTGDPISTPSTRSSAFNTSRHPRRPSRGFGSFPRVIASSASRAEPLRPSATSTFGSIDACKEQLATTAKTHFGSGWAWLVKNGDQVEILGTHDAGCPVRDGSLAGDAALMKATLDCG